MAGLRTANKTHRRHAETILIKPRLGGGNQALIISQAQIVVGAEINDFGARIQPDRRLLRRGNLALALVETVVADLLQRGA